MWCLLSFTFCCRLHSSCDFKQSAPLFLKVLKAALNTNYKDRRAVKSGRKYEILQNVNNQRDPTVNVDGSARFLLKIRELNGLVQDSFVFVGAKATLRLQDLVSWVFKKKIRLVLKHIFTHSNTSCCCSLFVGGVALQTVVLPHSFCPAGVKGLILCESCSESSSVLQRLPAGSSYSGSLSDLLHRSKVNFYVLFLLGALKKQTDALSISARCARVPLISQPRAVGDSSDD